ncbi:MAG: peptidase M48 [Oleiphilus sp.]|nr:MAG: peptidase M48 [Oleiphilus sp.]
MNFYRAQDEARKQTFWLLFLFILAVLSLVILTNLVVAIFVWYSDPASLMTAQAGVDSYSGMYKFWAIIGALGWPKAIAVSMLVCGTIAMAMLFKWLSLRTGGRVVAESLGGRHLQTNTGNLKEQQLLNIVEEMALASGVPVPPVYLMPHENGINAFAAGLSLKDAVIGVSQGAMQLLDREQLQGVVAHEFSHILNGDMRLNLKIVAVLHGILMIGEAGWGLFRISSRSSSRRSQRDNKGVGAIILLGLALMVLGWLGQFFGALIKAAVSRQREFLADASAVQFTRNPNGIGGALRTIGGHQTQALLQHPGAHELGHLFFAQSFRSRLFATHPPLDERIRKVLPRWQGDYLRPQQQLPPEAPVDPMQQMREQAATVASLAGTEFVQQNLRPEKQDNNLPISGSAFQDREVWLGAKIPSSLVLGAREPLDAAAMVLSLLLDPEPSVLAQQLELLQVHAASWLPLVQRYSEECRQLPLESRCPLLERLMPAVKSLSVAQYRSLRTLMPILIRADDRVDLIEWLIFELVRQHGDRHFGLVREMKPKYRKPNEIVDHYAIVASRLVHYGEGSEQESRKAFGKSANSAGVYTATLLTPEQCSGATFTKAVRELSRCYPLLKPRLLKGLVSAARHDGHINAHEQLMIAVIAQIWDCPVHGI